MSDDAPELHEAAPDSVLDSETPSSALALKLALSWSRATFIVGMALAAAFPDPDDFVAFLNDPDVNAEIIAYANLMRDIRHTAAAGLDGTALANYETLSVQHRDRAMEALTLTAERLRVDPEDLLTFYIHAG